MLTPSDKIRYDRQIRINEFGLEAQSKLKLASVLVIGAGALGSPVLLYLAAAGVGNIRILDGDQLEITNLHRQTLYSTQDIAQPKALLATKRLLALNPDIKVTFSKTFLTNENALQESEGYDIIIDCTDNFPTRYLVNDLCVLTGKTNVHGAISEGVGQVSVFNHLRTTGELGPNYRDLFPIPPHPEDVMSCAEAGVIGALPGIVGSVMAMEAIKVITGVGEVLDGRLWQMDSWTGFPQILKFTADEENPLTGKNPSQLELIDYQQFCGINKKKEMKSISVTELKEMMDKHEDFQLIDVREEYEYSEVNMGAELIPLSQLQERYTEIPKDKKVVVHCKMGGRSANAIQFLEQTQGYENLYNLEGGIMAWLTSK